MRTYYVQLTNLNHAIEMYADANPEVQFDSNQNESFLVFKRNDEIVGNFVVRNVIGWWCVN